MSDMFWIALFTGLPAIIGAIVAGWVAIKVHAVVAKVEVVKQATDVVIDQVGVIKKATDGMKTELVAEVRKASFAAGVKAEKDNPTEADG